MSDPTKKLDAAKLRTLEAAARKLAGVLTEAIKGHAAQHNDEWGFALLLFRFDSPELTWISNADRLSMIRVLEEMTANLKKSASTTSEQRN